MTTPCLAAQTDGVLPRWGLLAAVLGLVLLAGGCGNASFLGQGYNNFTAYYNTFYNANKAFDKGMETITSGAERVSQRHYIAVFQQPASGGEKNFKKAIDKSASLLRKHPDSKWVDDALILIGKSYYFQQNFVGAEQKFREVIDLDAELEGKARFWLARTLVTAERYEEAGQALTAGLGDQEDFDTWTDRLHLVRGQLAVRQGRWEEAETALQRGLGGEVPDDVAARGAFLLGQVQETLGKPDAAATAYDRVLEYGPRYELAYAAQYSAIRMLGQSDATEQALDRVRDMERDDKNYDRRFELTLLRGRLHRLQGDGPQAREILRSVLYGGDDGSDRRQGPSGAVEGRTHYALAILYRDAFSEFEKAAAHFDTASTSLGQPRGGGGQGQEARQTTPFAITDSGDLADRFGHIAERAQAVARMDSLLRLGQMPDEEFRAFVKELEAKRAAQRAAEERAREERESARRFASRRSSSARDRQRSRAASTVNDAESSFLYYDDPVRVQEARRSFQRIWGERPRVENWRRIEAVAGSRSEQDTVEQTAGAAGGGRPTQGASAQEGTGRAAQVDVSAVPRDSVAQAEMRRKRAVARYELGSALFLSASRPDSAAVWFERVIEENGEHPIARRALYALAEVHMAQGNTDRARTLYRRLLNSYPDSEFADRALQQLEGTSRPTVRSQEAEADSVYARAYATWQTGRLSAALQSMTAVVKQYPETRAAPQAALATGVIYHHLAASDTTQAPQHALDAVMQALAPPDSAQAKPPADSATASAGADTVQVRSTTSPPVAADSVRSDTTTRPIATAGNPASAPDTARRTSVDTTRTGKTPSPAGSLRRTAGADTIRRAPSDSTMRAVADSSREAPPDTAQPRANMARAVAAADSARSRTSAAGDAAPPDPLVTLLQRLADRYPDTPQAKRAQKMVAAMTGPAQDSTAAPSDSARVPADTAAVAQRPPSVDTTEADTTALSAPDPGAAPDSAAGDSPPPDTPSPSSPIPSPSSAPAPSDTAANRANADTTRRPIPRPPGRSAPPDSQQAPGSKIPSPTAPDTSSAPAPGGT